MCLCVDLCVYLNGSFLSFLCALFFFTRFVKLSAIIFSTVSAPYFLSFLLVLPAIPCKLFCLTVSQISLGLYYIILILFISLRYSNYILWIDQSVSLLILSSARSSLSLNVLLNFSVSVPVILLNPESVWLFFISVFLLIFATEWNIIIVTSFTFSNMFL